MSLYPKNPPPIPKKKRSVETGKIVGKIMVPKMIGEPTAVVKVTMVKNFENLPFPK
jgi:hypothetical protein